MNKQTVSDKCVLADLMHVADNRWRTLDLQYMTDPDNFSVHTYAVGLDKSGKNDRKLQIRIDWCLFVALTPLVGYTLYDVQGQLDRRIKLERLQLSE